MLARLTTVLVLLAIFVACTPEIEHKESSYRTSVPVSTRAPDGGIRHGERLYYEWQCDTCHGGLAEGGRGPSIASIEMEYNDFLMAIRETRPPKPAFSETEMSDEDVRDMYAFLQFLPMSLEIAEIQQLPQGEVLGMQLWTAYDCDSCHGAYAQGGADTPQLADTRLDWTAFEQETRRAAPLDAHSTDTIDDETLSRLHRWLSEGASILGGC